MLFKTSLSILLFLLLFVSNPIQAKTKATLENQLIKVKVATNRPQAIGAFYEGRKFQKNMIERLKQQCFVTIFIKNKSKDIIWLDLSKWEFSNAKGKITRLDRNYWREQWQAMNIPLAHQSTFRWTLLPEKLDFYPDEKEGGNIILPRLGLPFNISAQFNTGKNKEGITIPLNLHNLTCAKDEQ